MILLFDYFRFFSVCPDPIQISNQGHKSLYTNLNLSYSVMLIAIKFTNSSDRPLEEI